ncbi:MAG: tuaA [Acidobacteria bacterium]|jgi:sugar transferase (PEP-CTERM system associated)|nr:tuaA [Acidobacteriota bacterium]
MARSGIQPSLRTLLLIGCEAVMILAAVILAVLLRLGRDELGLMLREQGLLKALLITASCQFCLYYADLYDLRVVADRRELFVRTLQALGATSLILAVLYYWFPSLILGRGVFLIASVLVILITIGWRMAFEWASTRARPRERLLFVGATAAATQLARELYERRAELGVVIVGIVDADRTGAGEPAGSPGIVGTIEDIPSLVKSLDVDRVVVSLSDARGKLPMDRLLDMRMAGVAFAHFPTVYEEYTGKIAVDNLRPSWLIFSEGFDKTRTLRSVKRAFDVAGAAALLALAMPVMLLAALAIKLDSKGPALYTQQRVGLGSCLFTIYKFRSMRTDAEAGTGAVWATPGRDRRVTRIGHILRRTRLDELPQLWNVLRGDMSLVGPRPERPEFVQELTKHIPFYGQRHAVRPGLTGWAQVRYAYGASVEDSLEKLQYDLFYIKNMSLTLDLYIIFETLKTIVTRSGS